MGEHNQTPRVRGKALEQRVRDEVAEATRKQSVEQMRGQLARARAEVDRAETMLDALFSPVPVPAAPEG